MSDLLFAQKKELVDQACFVRKNAYVPYSHYPVGAALLTTSGKIFTGVNIDNASYPATVCAECVAVYKAVSEGERGFLAIAVVTRNGGFPCGICRQVLSEFGGQTLVINANEKGEILKEMRVDEMLLEAFGPDDLTR
jgi:cytidine deaminase